MSNPRNMRTWALPLEEGARVHIYSDSAQILLQLRRSTATEHDVLAPSFKVAVSLAPVDALALAGELLTAASGILKRAQGEEPEQPEQPEQPGQQPGQQPEEDEE